MHNRCCGQDPSTLTLIFKRIIKGQMERFFKPVLSSLLSGFRDSYSTQHSLVKVIETWKRSLDLSGIVSTVLMDLSKAYDCVSHDFLIAKLEGYGFHSKSLRLLYSYLTNRKQRVKLGSYKSSQRNIKIGVPQGFVLGPLLFIMLYLEFDSEMCNFADDNTGYTCGIHFDEITTKLENDLSSLLNLIFGEGHGSKPW